MPDERRFVDEEENPKIIGPPSPDFKMKDLEKAIGKTISDVEFGEVEGLPA